MGVKGKPDITDIIQNKQPTMVWQHETDARGENTKINYGMDIRGETKKRTSKKNVDGRSTSSHDREKFRTRSMEKRRGMAFGSWKTVTAVTKPDRQTDRHCLLSSVLYVTQVMLQTSGGRTFGTTANL
jgi:hypothetical protein